MKEQFDSTDRMKEYLSEKLAYIYISFHLIDFSMVRKKNICAFIDI
jgi:hypothetical protein